MIEDGFDIKQKVEDVLNETGFSESRVAKMDIDDLLKYASQRSPNWLSTDSVDHRLLAAFHDVGIHFA